MIFGKDTFKWISFIFQLIKLFTVIFGDDDDKEELNKNGVDHING